MKNYIESQYGIEVTAAKQLSKGVGGDVFCLETPRGKYIFKIIDSSEMNKPEQEAPVCRRLLDDGIPASVFVQNSFGAYVSKYSDGRFCHLQMYVEGECFAPNSAPQWYMDETSQTLGKIHRSLSKLPPLGEGIGVGFFKNATPERALQSYENSLAVAVSDGDASIISDLEFRIELVRNMPAAEFDLSRLTIANTHGDYTVNQIICKDEHIAGIIDWTSACRHPVIWEISRSFFLAASSAAEGELNRADFDRYVAAYCRHGHLTDYDRENLINLYYYQLAVCNYYGQYQSAEGAKREEYLEQARFATKLLRGLRGYYGERL